MIWLIVVSADWVLPDVPRIIQMTHTHISTRSYDHTHHVSSWGNQHTLLRISRSFSFSYTESTLVFLHWRLILKRKKHSFVNQFLDQGSDYDKNVFMFILGKVFLVAINNNHLQSVFTSRYLLSHLSYLAFELLDAQWGNVCPPSVSHLHLPCFLCCCGLQTAQGLPLLLADCWLCHLI